MRWFLSLVLAVAAAPFAWAQAPAPGDVVVNEIMYDPPTGGSSNEWVEVVNRSDGAVDLGGVALGDAASTSDPIPGSLVLQPGEFAVLVRDGTAFATAFPGTPFVELASFPALNNTGDRVRLVLNATELDAVPYTASWGGSDASLERRDPDGPSGQSSNFGTTTDPDGGTPDATNSLFAQDTDPPDLVTAEAVDATTVRATFDEPLDPTTGLDAQNYQISDGIGTPSSAAFDSDPSVILLSLATALTSPTTYTLTVSGVEDPSGNVLASDQATFFFGQGDTAVSRDLVINEFLYDEPTANNPGEFVELFNRTNKSFDLRDFTLNDGTGADTPITTQAVFVDPGGYVVIVEDGALFEAIFPGTAFVEQPSWSALNNTGDAIVLKYQGTVVDSLMYATSWGGQDASLERKDPDGPSSVSANWATTTAPDGGTPGEQNSQFAPDVTGPMLVGAAATRNGQTVTVDVDEPLDPASVSAGAFTVTGGATVTAAAYDDAELTVTLTLSARLAGGTTTITASGLRDLLGNTTAQTSTTLDFTPDETLPTILRATAETSTTLRVEFSEPVTDASAGATTTYSVDGGVGAPTTVTTEPATGEGIEAATLTFTTPFPDRQQSTVTATGLMDLADNTQPLTSATFFSGEGDVAELRDLVINEFLYDEPSADNPGEFVELFNRSDGTFDLRDFTLNDGTGDDEPITDQAVFLAPDEYAVVVEDGALFAAVFPDVAFIEQPSWSALNNGGDAIVLKYQGAVVDSLFYQPSWGGEDASLERKDPDGPSSVAANWATTTDLRGGTPGQRNSQFAPDVTGPQLLSAAPSRDGRTLVLTLNEPLDPATVTAGAFAVPGGPAVQATDYTAESTTVTLTLAAALSEGESTVTASGLADLLGNVTDQSSATVTFIPDVTPPSLSRATATSATTIRVLYSEPVTEASAVGANYAIANFGQSVTSVAVDARSDGGVTAAILTLTGPLQGQTLYSLSADGLIDLAGNASGVTTTRFFFGTADAPAAGELVVTEIMYDPATGSAGEYLEVLNTTEDRIFDLRGITLDDGDGDGDALSDEPVLVLPGQYLALTRDLDGFRITFPEADAVQVGSIVGLSNSGEAIVLRANGAVVDSVFYDPDWHRIELDDATGISLERRDPAGPSNAASNWSSSLADLGGTPSAENTLSIFGTPVERDGGVTVTSPFAPTRGEAAEITYTLSTEVALVRARIFDGGGREVRELEPGRLSGSEASLTWDGTGDDRQPLRAGIYVVLIEAVNAQGGTTEAHRTAIVLARPD